ncbi:MAG: hypothetical protein ACREDR_45225, partial [Blastocatellia bacterium]
VLAAGEIIDVAVGRPADRGCTERLIGTIRRDGLPRPDQPTVEPSASRRKLETLPLASVRAKYSSMPRPSSRLA